jgi:hypothetical protein
MIAQYTADNIIIDLDAKSQRDLLSNSGTTPAKIRRFITMRSFFGPFGPGRRRRSDENNALYSRLRSTVWRYSRVEGFRTMADRRIRAARMNGVHTPAMIRSVARRLGARLRLRLRINR